MQKTLSNGQVVPAVANVDGDGNIVTMDNGKVPVLAQNIATKFRDAFEAYTPGEKWTQTLGSGDIVAVDGNTAAASYLVVSKSPLFSGTESAIETVGMYGMPIELAFGASMSQRTLGQEFSVELVSVEPQLPDVPDIAISVIVQNATTLAVDTVTPHGLAPGKSIGIRGCADSRANYPALVVATIPSPTQFTATAGPGGTLPSLTISSPTGAKGSVYFRERLGRAQNGAAQIFENASVTQASLYIRSESGDALPSGTIVGSHVVTVGTTAPVQLVNAPYSYAFAPSTEFRLNLQADRTQWYDSAVDAISQTTSRLLRTQVCPDPEHEYKLRLRATNNKSLTVPSAQIVTAVKTGTTTATITTATPHGLLLNDPVVIYGIRDQGAAAFPSLPTATAVASVVDAVTFTIVIGTAGTSTSSGGYVAKVQGGNLMSVLGAIGANVVSGALSTLSDGTRQLVLTASGNWAGLTIGDMAELIGVRVDLTGVSLGVDGPWKVANSVTTVLTLVLPFAGQRTLPSDFVSTNCGGGVIKRTCFRLSFVRLFDYERQRVEMLTRPAGDISAAAPVTIQNTPAVTVSSGTVTTVTTVTGVTTAGTPAAPATPVIINSLATTNGQLVLTGTSGLQALYATNSGATAAFVKLFNKATAPTVGTDVPAMIISVPAAVSGVPGAVEITPGFNGYRFALGLGLAITGAAADADTTAVAAGQVKVILSRTA